MLLFVCFLLVGGSVFAQVPPPFDLQTAYLYNPLGIDASTAPFVRLSWGLTHPGFGQVQTAYRVQVVQNSSSGDFVIWDSEQVNSSHHYTTYGSVGNAKPLLIDTSYSWQVMWWDSLGAASGWSEPAYFGTGLDTNDWAGQWIGGQGNLLRKEFQLSGNLTRARAYISGLGYYVLYINGQRVGDAILDVGWTTYSARCLYNVYDVTSYLQEGDNVVGVMQGHGWYASNYTNEPNGPRSVIFQLSVDGAVAAPSDTTWYSSPGPILYDDIYNGETYDARLEQPGWNAPGFVQSGSWTPATTVVSPGCVLSYQTMPNVREKDVLTPVAITNPKKDIYIVDFGQNFSGYLKVTLSGPSGSFITLHHAELLSKDGSGLIYTVNLLGAIQTDKFILNGSSTPETFTPHFTYHGFRYVQWNATNNPDLVPTMDNVIAIHVHTDVAPTGSISFTASSNVLNQIQHNTIWGQTSNLMSIPTDCDQRNERKGWMGDAQISAEEAIHNFHMPAFYINFLQNIQDVQDDQGTITDTVPYTFGLRPADPSWGAAYPNILYWVWKYYDDVEIVEKHYDSIRMYIDYMLGQTNQSGLTGLFYWYGDWVPPPPASACSSHLTSSFSFLTNLEAFIEMAEATGHSNDATAYAQQQTRLLAEFNTAFFNADTAYYDTGLQSPQSFALTLGVVPPQSYHNFTVNLLNDIVSAHDTHLTTGITGAKYLMLELYNIGRADIALQLAEKFDYPSWGFMAYNPAEPATTLWEMWDTPDATTPIDSRNHIMFGAVSDWFYKALAGINPVEGDTGYANFNIAPSVVGDLLGVSATFLAGMGNISVSWQRQGGSSICATAPENYYAELDCASIGSDGVIEEITFASFGLPYGTCNAFGPNAKCHSPKSQVAVENECLGKKSCRILAHENVMGAASCLSDNVFKRLHIQAKCSVATPTTLGLSATIPVGSTANVVLPLLDLAGVSVLANNVVVWENDSFTPGAPGISAGHRNGNTISLVTGSGEYTFNLTGSPGDIVCAGNTEYNNISLACPVPGQIITQVQFASFGNPSGQCGQWFVGSCNAGSSQFVVENLCLLKESCEFVAVDTIFQDPCPLTPKYFAAQVVCAKP